MPLDDKKKHVSLEIKNKVIEYYLNNDISEEKNI